MPGSGHEAIVRRYYDKATEGDVATIEELLDPGFVLHSPISDEPIRGIDGFKQMIAMYRAGAPDFTIQVDHITEHGDTLFVRWRTRYKHTGTFRDKPPTGKSGEISGSDEIRIAGGKIVEVTNAVDLAAAERQVGFVPDLRGEHGPSQSANPGGAPEGPTRGG